VGISTEPNKTELNNQTQTDPNQM